MTFIKRLLSIAVFTFCFLTAIVLFAVSIDSTITGEDKIFSDIFLFIIGTLSFLFARWLWRTAKATVHLDPIEITDSVIGDIQSSPISGSPINWAIRASIVSCAVSGVLALYLYFVPYKSALSKVGESAPWVDALCFAEAVLLEEAWGCQVIGKPLIGGIRKAMIEEQIESLEGWLILLAVIFVIGLVVAVLPRKVAEHSPQKQS